MEITTINQFNNLMTTSRITPVIIKYYSDRCPYCKPYASWNVIEKHYPGVKFVQISAINNMITNHIERVTNADFQYVPYFGLLQGNKLTEII